MWRSFFLAGGFFLILLGGQSLILDSVSLTKFKMPNSKNEQNLGAGYANQQNSPYSFAGYGNQNLQSPGNDKSKQRVVQIKEWMPWCLFAAGTIIVLYTFSLPKRTIYESRHSAE